MKSVEELDVFKLAHELALKTNSTTKVFPREETFSLLDQMRRTQRLERREAMERLERLEQGPSVGVALRLRSCDSNALPSLTQSQSLTTSTNTSHEHVLYISL